MDGLTVRLDALHTGLLALGMTRSERETWDEMRGRLVLLDEATEMLAEPLDDPDWDFGDWQARAGELLVRLREAR